jgi:lipid-binding SYLF domain-containing protein
MGVIKETEPSLVKDRQNRRKMGGMIAMRAQIFRKNMVWMACFIVLGTMVLPSVSHAATAQAIDASADKILQQFKTTHQGADAALKQAKGVLVFPEIVKAGFIVGGSYGEGALRIHGKSVAYYSIGSGSVGFTFGAQSQGVIILFMKQAALDTFRKDARTDKAYQVGVSGDITAVNLGAGGAVANSALNNDIVSFVMDQKGLMVNLSLQGSKITKLQR